eukprot:TRINITY_DN50_c0_g2_i2.p1 TRINITY_DN50_c0_g2~~TRINITY_DN50_c0_g2_i2.p1  ORF type:complete len:791 (+),score=53.07 TRINITY_DN50_c0_g2_i2:2261-4633(+)
MAKNQNVFEGSIDELLNSLFRETDLEVLDITDVHKSVEHAVTLIPSKLALDPPVKVMLTVLIEYTTVDKNLLEVWVSTRQQAIHSYHDFKSSWADEMNSQFNRASEEAKLRGSGWSEGTVLEIKLKQSKFAPIVGHSYIPLPKELVLKRAILNIKNTDNRCFMWCVLAKLHHIQKNAERVIKYEPYIKELNFGGIEFPVRIDQIDRFEEQNKVTVNVYEWSHEEGLLPLRVSPGSPTIGDPDKNHVDLLLFTDGSKHHYTLIRTMSRLLAYTSAHKGKQEFCRRCLLRIPSIGAALKHREHCNSSVESVTKLETPKPGKKVIFENWKKMQKNPYVVYADFESLIVPYQGPELQNLPKTVVVNNHQICSYAFIVVRSDGGHSEPYLYRGPDAAKHFLERMKLVHTDLSGKLNLNKIVMTPENQEQYDSATRCWICESEFKTEEDPKVRDHDHISGKFRGAAHSKCNLQLKFEPMKWKLPIFFHNLRGYDSHLILQAVTEEYNVSCIAQSSEKYMTFTLNYLTFYDSAQHMMGALESLANSLSTCSITTEYFDPTLVRKGVYPYEYMNSWERFDEDELPPKDAFFSSLRGTGISDEDYQHAQTAWKELKCRTMGDYHDHYLMADVCLLADVFENYRKTCMKHYSLDPSHYISAPGMSWDAFLRFTGVEIDLIYDLPMLQMIENGLRGGISMASHNYCKANNKYLDDYDPSKPSNYIMYLDANNLYGYAMCQALPLRNFKMMQGPPDVNTFLTALGRMTPDQPRGMIAEVDLEYPHVLCVDTCLLYTSDAADE